jgi:glutathione synthase
MTNKIIAIQGDHPKKLNPKSDTSIFLAVEAQNKKYNIFYYEPKNLSIIGNKVIAQGFFIKFNYSSRRFYKIIKYKKLDLSKCKFILIRQDPPFNLEYISTTFILDNLRNNVKIVNNPMSIRNVSEKLYSAKYLKFMPKTIFTKDLKEIKKFHKINKKMIIKPIHSYSGNDIHLIDGYFKNKLITKFIKKHGYIMCQKFLPKIKNGDKRVWVINGKICGAISRVPKKNSFLSNLSKGAIAVIAKPTSVEKKISKIIAKDLKKENIYFAGLDFIDSKLNGDINVTSPTGLKTYYDLSKINLAKIFWKGLGA